jgi:hypothetical protein
MKLAKGRAADLKKLIYFLLGKKLRHLFITVSSSYFSGANPINFQILSLKRLFLITYSVLIK